MEQIKYIYEDKDILVAHKPAGVATEGAKASNIDLVSAARNYIKREGKISGVPYVATVHRLDQPVEGVVVLAKTKKAATDIASQIKKHTTEKYYYALCYGSFTEEKGRLEDILIRKEDGLAAVISEKEAETYSENAITTADGKRIKLTGGEPKKASLEYEVVKRTEKATLLRIRLLTGRYHQIRVQLSHLGYPILGERKYGTDSSIEYSNEMNAKNICLVSYKFCLKHPSTKKRMEFEIIPDNVTIRKVMQY